MSGMDAVKKIVQTEGQARRIVEEAKAKAEQIVLRAHEVANRIRQEAISQAQRQREEILKAAKEKAESEALRSDIETEQILENYRKLSEERKAAAVNKAVELVLGGR